MIPNLVDIGGGAPWPVLPKGVHQTTLREIRGRFATTPHRKRLFAGFVRAVRELAKAGCKQVYLDGSYVTGSPHPSDYDGCWAANGVDPFKLDHVLLDSSNGRAAQKQKYLGEFFIDDEPLAEGFIVRDYFQRDKYSKQPKGILLINLPDNTV